MTQTTDFVSLLQEQDADNAVFVKKEADGRYHIVAVSTAALPDREDETFTTKAMDFDIIRAKETGNYPEIRVFHAKPLGIGKVEKMSRVGIFAVDEGHSYTDDFSLEVCEKMLLNNDDGKWRVSRGFRVLKVAGGCPNCNEQLVIQRKHMIGLGFRCPTCKEIHSGYKGLLNDVQFLETDTFDITVTDVPAVPYTGVAAFRPIYDGETIMTKEQLKERLLKAGLSERVIDSRLKSLAASELKELLAHDDIPEATLLKEFKEKTKPPMPPPAKDEEEEDDEEYEDDEDKEYFTLDSSVLDAFRGIVREEVKELLSEAELEVGDDLEIEVKESPLLADLADEVAELKEMVATLLSKDEQRLKHIMRKAPRNGKLRILRYKEEDDEDEEEEEDEDTPEEKMYPFDQQRHANGGVIVDPEGNQYKSMTDLLLNG